MNDEMTHEVELDEVEENAIPSELESLRARADQMGVAYRHNTGVAKLRIMVAKAQEPTEAESEVKVTKAPKVAAAAAPKTQSQMVAEIRKEAAKLVRIRITCMNPNKKNWEGEIFSVGSAKLGTFKKFVPFDAPDGWHVPNIIFEMIKERKCSVFYSATTSTGTKTRKSKLVPEFSIDILPPLTEQEMRNLARQQALVNDE